MKTFLLTLLITLSASSCFSQTWDDNFVGIDSLWNNFGADAMPYDFFNYKDSILFIGGTIRCVNQDTVNDILQWDMNTAHGFQNGVEWGRIMALVMYHDSLYIGGDFESASENPNTQGLAIWNGTNWQGTRIGEFDSDVEDFCIYNDTLIVGGRFGHIGTDLFYKIAAYDGENWINIGYMGTWVSSLTVFNGDLYAGGYFGLRKYLGGTEWEDFAVEPNDFIFALETDTINSFMYVGGQFSGVAGQVSMGSAMWDGFNWHPLGDYCGATVWHQAMEIYRGDLYTGGGLYYNEDEEYLTFITKWNGESWDSIGGAFSDNIFALEIFRDTLYIGGGFQTWDSIPNGDGIRSKGIVKLYMPDNGCDYLKPRINTYADTFYLNGGEVDVNLYNNNPYVDTWEWDFTSASSVTIPPPSNERNPIVTFSEVGEYNVQVTVTDGECVKTANKTIYIELGNEVAQFEQIDMQVHPNPSSNDFTVKVTLPNYHNAEIKIAGLNGHLRSVIPVTGETTVIPTKGWKAGVYVCNLFVEGKLVKAEKLVFE